MSIHLDATICISVGTGSATVTRVSTALKGWHFGIAVTALVASTKSVTSLVNTEMGIPSWWSNEEVLQRGNETRTVLDTVGKCKHVVRACASLRHESLLHDIIEGRMKGKARNSRKRMHLLSDLMKNRSYTEVKRAQDRVGCTVNVTNLLVTAED